MLTKEWEYSFSSLRKAILDVDKDRENRLKSQRKFEAKMKIRDKVSRVTTKLLCRHPRTTGNA